MCQTSTRVGEPGRNACANHPGRSCVEQFGKLALCEECRRGRLEATRGPHAAAAHAACAVWRAADGRWTPLRERAPAHWLAHELRIKAPAGAASCAFGHPLEVEDLLLQRRRVVAPTPLATGDLWVDLDGRGCGVVVGVDRRDGLRVLIRHLDARRGNVSVSEFYEVFEGRGGFHR